jgi:hypothetical protein
MAKIDVKEFIESLKEMTILEIKALVDAMKEEFGIDPSAVSAAPAAAARCWPCSKASARKSCRRWPPRTRTPALSANSARSTTVSARMKSKP